ncbi:MAG: HD domain-containing protein [Veillonellaceae bacterium]|mgnify:CR=1 FL=1|jgi:predicted HD superfamily hydrolase involved in NAD metabolism|nr:HD domain-containing protein [Veillonellaceae bacterium]
MELEAIIDKLKISLTPKRLLHSYGVSETAVLLASKYDADQDKARLAGILHDCAREIPSRKLADEASKRMINIDEVERLQPILLHAALGAKLAEEKYGIRDKEILEAIEKHTVGGLSMSKLAKIVYLADFIEPNRNFPGVEKLRQIAENNLDHAVLAAYDHTLEYIIKQRGLIHPATVAGRNQILKNITE